MEQAFNSDNEPEINKISSKSIEEKIKLEIIILSLLSLIHNFKKEKSLSCDGSTFIEWNIDGRSKSEILSLLQEMHMVIVAFKSKEQSSKRIAVAISYGFTRKLARWLITSLKKNIFLL